MDIYELVPSTWSIAPSQAEDGVISRMFLYVLQTFGVC